MARVLYRLGRFAARRSWVVIVAWIVLLAGAGVGFLNGGGTLSDDINIPGTATQRVQDRLEKLLGGADHGSGTIVIQSKDGHAISASEQTKLSRLLAGAGKVSGVDSVSDPFVTTRDRQDQSRQLEAARSKIETAQGQLAAGQTALDASLSALNSAITKARAAGTYAAAKTQFDAKTDAIAKQQATIDSTRATLTTKNAALEQGAALIALSKDYRTLSTDESTAIVGVTFAKAEADVTASTKTHLRDLFTGSAVSGVTVNFSKQVAAASGAAAPTELAGLVIAAVILMVMLGTLVAAGLPLVAAVVGVGVSMLTVLSFSKIVDLNATTPILGLMLGLAVGIDYTLFIVNRHRQQLRRGMPMAESIGTATGTSGTAVVFAGATVIIALLALNVTGIPFLGLMGVAGAAAIAAAVLVAITLTPALLGLVGRRIIAKRDWARIGTLTPEGPTPSRPMSTRRAVITVVTSAVVLGVIALPALSMRLGLPDASGDPHDSTTYKAYSEVVQKFGAGQNAPLTVVADLPAGLTDAEVTTDQLRIGRALMGLGDVRAVVPAVTTKDNQVTLLQVTPNGGPNDESTAQLVHRVRALTLDGNDITFSVAGTASANIDISEKIGSALPPYLIIVIVLSILIMIVVFRSLLVPVIATGGFILSLFAALGGVTAIYQFGWLSAIFGVSSTGPVLSFLPIMLVGILFGLAMDYQLFIATGIREAYVHGASARAAITAGVRHGRTVVTAAALIMAGVFGGFIFGDSSVVKPLGFGLAFGVLVDAFVIRMVFLPAVMHLLGDSAWWLPRWLDRVLPNVDVEGATLERQSTALSIEDEATMLEPASATTTR